MNDPTQPDTTAPDTTNQDPNVQDPNTPTQYIVHHQSQTQDIIIGWFDNEMDATDAMNAYHMQNTVDLNDVVEVRQII